MQGSAILLFSKKRIDKKVKREKKEESGDMDIYIIIIHTQGRWYKEMIKIKAGKMRIQYNCIRHDI